MKVIAGLYSDRDYDEIRSYLYDNVYSLGYIKELNRPSPDSVDVTCAVYQVAADVEGNVYDYIFTIDGSAKFDPETNEFYQVEQGALTFKWSSFSSGASSMGGGPPSISDDGSRVSFVGICKFHAPDSIDEEGNTDYSKKIEFREFEWCRLCYDLYIDTVLNY